MRFRAEFGKVGRPDTLVLLCLRVWYRSILHSVLIWLLDSLGGKHTPVSLKGSHAVGSCRSRCRASDFPFQKKGNSVSIPFHYCQNLIL